MKIISISDFMQIARKDYGKFLDKSDRVKVCSFVILSIFIKTYERYGNMDISSCSSITLIGIVFVVLTEMASFGK